MQEIGIHRERRFAALVLGDGNLVLFGIAEQRRTAPEIPFAPGCDHLDRGIERIGGQFEPDLVIALAGGAMGNGVGAGFLGDFDETLGDQRAGDGGAEQILAFINRIGAEHGEDEVAHEFLAQVLDADVLDAEHLGLLARRLELFALAKVGGEGHHFAIIGFLQPFQDDGGVEPARIGQHDLLDVLSHGSPSQV
ncbi:hypothetical protein D3C87_1372140 [compost metagenome]